MFGLQTPLPSLTINAPAAAGKGVFFSSRLYSSSESLAMAAWKRLKKRYATEERRDDISPSESK